jgi:hypothetical protein
MDLTFKELDDHFKTYSELTVQQGQICVRPGVRKNIKAFIQWSRDEFRLGRDPSSIAFPVGDVSDFIRRYKTHEKYQTDSKTLAEAAKPEKFKESIKWEDRKPTFLNYIRAILGRDAVPNPNPKMQRVNQVGRLETDFPELHSGNPWSRWRTIEIYMP